MKLSKLLKALSQAKKKFGDGPVGIGFLNDTGGFGGRDIAGYVIAEGADHSPVLVLVDIDTMKVSQQVTKDALTEIAAPKLQAVTPPPPPPEAVQPPA